MRLLDVTPLIKELHRPFVAKASSSVANVDALAWHMAVAPVSLSKGVGHVTLYGVTYPITPDTLCCMKTMDGGIVTDYTIPFRGVLMGLLAPIMGQRMSKSPRVMAEYLQSLTWRFFQGGSVGGAVLDSGRWKISPHWIPIETPNPVAVLAASVEDPVVRSMNLLGFKDDQNAEDVRKGAQCAVDPFYTFLAMGGNTMIRYERKGFLDEDLLERWKPQLHHAGGDAQDVTYRAGTFVPTVDGEPWQTDAYEGMLKSGSVMTMLQAPRIFCVPGALHRLVWDAVAGCHWFTTIEKDFRVDGLSPADVITVRDQGKALKFAWLDLLRGVRPQDGALVTAFNASPMGYANLSLTFNAGAAGEIIDRITLNENILLMMRSDPRCPETMKWLINEPGKTISRSWIREEDEWYYNILKQIS